MVCGLLLGESWKLIVVSSPGSNRRHTRPGGSDQPFAARAVLRPSGFFFRAGFTCRHGDYSASIVE